jgi:hypothetical protein
MSGVTEVVASFLTALFDRPATAVVCLGLLATVTGRFALAADTNAAPVVVQFFVPMTPAEEKRLAVAIDWLAHNATLDPVSLSRGDDLIVALKHRYGDAWPEMWPAIRQFTAKDPNFATITIPAQPPPNLIMDKSIAAVLLPAGPRWERSTPVVVSKDEKLPAIALRDQGRASPLVLSVIEKDNQLTGPQVERGQRLVLTKSFGVQLHLNGELSSSPLKDVARTTLDKYPYVEPIDASLASDDQCTKVPKRKTYPMEWEELRHQLEINSNHSSGNGRTIIAVVDSGTALDEPARRRLSFWQDANLHGPNHEEWVGYDLTRNADEADQWPAATALEVQFKNHGTHVAGIIQGAPSPIPALTETIKDFSQIMMLKVFPKTMGVDIETIDASALLYAFDLAYKKKAGIVHLSIESSDKNPAFGEFAQHPDTLYVVAAGNRAQDIGKSTAIPAWFGGTKSSNVLVVAAYDASGKLDPESNYGAERVDIAAPGECIESLAIDPLKPHSIYSGTSQAAPFVTMTAAILMGYGLPAASVKHRIDISSDYEPLYEADKSKNAIRRTWTVGRLNAVKALSFWEDIVDHGSAKPLRYERGIVTTTTYMGNGDYSLRVDSNVFPLKCILKITPLKAGSTLVRVWYALGGINDQDIGHIDGRLNSDILFGPRANQQAALPIGNFTDIVLSRSARIDTNGNTLNGEGPRCEAP